MTGRAPTSARGRTPHSRSPRRWWVLLVALVAVATALTSFLVARHGDRDVTADPAGSGTDDAPMAFGVLGSRCDAQRAAALHEAGVRYAEYGLDWSSFEPRAGQFDADYEGEVKRAVAACHKAGIGVVLTLGLHAAPAWVADLRGGAYVDQGGQRGPDDVPNLVFSAAVRDAVKDYLTELDQVVGLDSLAAIRVGTGTNGELGYPSGDTSTDNPFWAFDQAAQTGTGLADGATPSPMPGWEPGSTTWRGAAVSTADVQRWFDWYSSSVADAVVWVVRELRDLGYTHDVHLPLAGRGALPADLRRAVAAHLDGTADRDGSLESGLYYPDQLTRIGEALKQTEQPGWGTVSADSGSVDDATAVHARRLDPPQDRCRSDDADHDLIGDAAVADWPSYRWTAANARRAGLGLVGENPGSPNTPGTGGNDDTDSSEEQMDIAPQYAAECGMTLFQWAFEDDLFSHGRQGLNSYADRIGALAADPAGTASASGTKGGGR